MQCEMTLLSDFFCLYMVTSSNGNIFRVTSPLSAGSTGRRWIPLTKAIDAELWCFLWSAPEQAVEQTIETPEIWDIIALTLIIMVHTRPPDAATIVGKQITWGTVVGMTENCSAVSVISMATRLVCVSKDINPINRKFLCLIAWMSFSLCLLG